MNGMGIKPLFSKDELRFIKLLMEDLEARQGILYDDLDEQESLYKSITKKLHKPHLNARIDPSLAGKVN